MEQRTIACAPAVVLFSIVCGCAGPTPDAADQIAYTRQHYVKSEHMVPMRDNVDLFTIVYEPKDRSQTYPVLLFRTPYSIAPYGPDDYRELLGPSREFDEDGYIFVFQDVRGKFKSEGEFEVIKPLYRDAGAERVDESTDNYDTIDWILGNVTNHNGRVGQWGISYPGWQTVMGMIDPHPALAAASPQASPSDMFIGDDWHHNGAFRIMYAFSWLAGNARRRDQPTEARGERFDYGTDDGYEFFLSAGTASRIDELFFGSEVPAWRDFIEHPNYDEFWQRQNALQHLEEIDMPVLNVAGWFDTEDFYGPMSIYKTIEDQNPANKNTLVVGPWLHGGWRSMEGDYLGCVGFDRKTSLDFQRETQFPFFNYYLKDKGDWVASEAVVFETGANQWRTHDQWPPANVIPVDLYFHADGALSFDKPQGNGTTAFDQYVSDPDNPVPFSAEKRTTLGHLWKVEDQRFASERPDVLVYQSEVLTEDLTIAGPILADIFVATTGTDSDWIVKVIDVYPDESPASQSCDVPMGGFQMHLAGEIMRGRFRNSLDQPEPMVPGQVTPIHINLKDRYHTFKAGHRIMIHVQSSWFPAYDRNPQTFVDTYRAVATDFQEATQTIYRTGTYASHITFGVLKGGTQ